MQICTCVMVMHCESGEPRHPPALRGSAAPAADPAVRLRSHPRRVAPPAHHVCGLSVAVYLFSARIHRNNSGRHEHLDTKVHFHFRVIRASCCQVDENGEDSGQELFSAQRELAWSENKLVAMVRVTFGRSADKKLRGCDRTTSATSTSGSTACWQHAE